MVDVSTEARRSSPSPPGTLVISLDLELYWGVRDKRSLEQHADHLRGVRDATEKMLATFAEYGVHATWATVGFLFFRNAEELKRNLPTTLPEYSDQAMSPYRYIDDQKQLDEICHFAPDLIELIRKSPGQEIATHTFSHFYCLEQGQSLQAFRADISAALEAAEQRGVHLESLVFPRNQWNPAYLPLLNELGIKSFRGTEKSRFHQASNDEAQSSIRRAVRLLDAYVNLTGHHTYDRKDCIQARPFNIASSRFLRPYSSRLAFLEPLRLNRIRKAMNDAAANGRVFHLWWHPENFGTHTDSNVRFLRKVLEHFLLLKTRHGMQSKNMGELARELEQMYAA